MDTNSVSFAYGLHIPIPAPGSAWQEADRIDEALRTLADLCPEVHYVAGGSCTTETVFLVAYSRKIAAGGHGGAAGVTAEQRAGWDAQLVHAARVLGYSGLAAPDWLCITDLS